MDEKEHEELQLEPSLPSDTEAVEEAKTEHHSKYLSAELTHRAAGVLVGLGYTSRSQIRHAFDNFGGIKGIGEVLKKTLDRGLEMGPAEFEEAFPGISSD